MAQDALEFLANWRGEGRGLKVEEKRLDELADLEEKPERKWGMIDGFFRRRDGAFFSALGLLVRVVNAGREVASWPQLILRESGEGRIIFVMRESGAEGYEFLVQAKAEPGNPEHNGLRTALFAPIVQASQSNIDAAHGGKEVRWISELLPLVEEDEWYTAHQDGGRFDQKVNRYAFIRVIKTRTFKTQLNENEIWVSRDDLRRILAEGEANQHLREAAGLMWALF